MPDNQQPIDSAGSTNNQTPQAQPFTTKVVETPILDSQLRERMNQNMNPELAGGFKGFYQTNKFYFWAIILGIVVIGLLAFFAFRKQPVAAPKEANVAINVDVPATVASGGEAVYKITVQNNDPQKLVNMQIELTYDNGMSYESSSPNADNLSGTLFTLPASGLITGQNVAIFVKTKVTGNINDQKTLGIKLHYHYSNLNSEFIKQQSSVVQLVASNIIVELDGPTTTNNAQLVVYSVKYQNNSDGDIQSARIKMDYPQGFVFAQAQPAPDIGSDTWNVGTLAKGGSGSIQIQGTFNSANPGESKSATAEFLILGTNGQFFTQNTSNFTTSISSLPLLVTQQLQPANPAGVINPGDTLTFQLTYQNNSSVAATGVNVEADLNSKVLDLSSLRAEGGQINNNTISWNASGVPQLGSLLPNQSGQLSFSVRVNNPATKDSTTNLTIASAIKINSNQYATAFPGNQLNLKVSSPTRVDTGVTYVSGQLPPQVGRSTTFAVNISLTNSSNDFSNGIVTAFIPLGSGGFSSSSVTPAESGNVQYDPATGKLTWNVGRLPANTGRFTQSRSLQFNVTLNPSSSQAGQSVVLVKTINFTATDLFTNQSVSANASNVTTNNLPGANGYSNGIVQQ